MGFALARSMAPLYPKFWGTSCGLEGLTSLKICDYIYEGGETKGTLSSSLRIGQRLEDGAEA